MAIEIAAMLHQCDFSTNFHNIMIIE